MVRKINKRASLDDLGYILGVLLVFGFLLLILGSWTDSFNEKIQDMSIIPDDGKQAIGKVNNLYSGALDNSFLFLAIGLAVISILFAMMVIVHPIFFIFYVIALTVVIFVSGILSNIYQEAAANPQLAPMAAKLLYTSQILNFLPLFAGIIGTIIAIVMYKNWRDA